jgi:hypothetical protein
MARIFLEALGMAAALVLLLLPHDANAVSNICPSGTCDIADPIFVNVFWDTSVKQWDIDIKQSDPSATVERIDLLTQALFHSKYFVKLSQYSITNTTNLHNLPSFVANTCGPPPITIDQAFEQMHSFAWCVMSAHPELIPGRTVINLFLPPQVAPSSPTAKFCNGLPDGSVANHDQYDSYPLFVFKGVVIYAPVEIAVIPTNAACNPSIAKILQSATHEMVESATDPNPSSPTGWKVFGTSKDEVADQCEDSTAANVPFLYGRVATYFSDSDNTCMAFSRAPPIPAPVVVNSSVCGSGSDMQITLTGSFGDAFSGAPWDLVTTPASYPAPAASRTLYLQAAISGTTHSWLGGNFAGFPPDSVGLGKITWKALGGNSDSIVVSGFDSHYGILAPNGLPSTVLPGDQIALTVSSPETGQSTVASVTAPGPSKVAAFQFLNSFFPVYYWSPPSTLYYGDHPTSVVGRLVDSGGCGVEHVPVTVSSSDSPPDVEQTSTLNDGSFEVKYQIGGHAGKHTVKLLSPITANATVAIHPVASYLNATIGTTAGQQAVTLSGAGYAPGVTSVVFRSGPTHADATAVTVPDSNTVSFLTPPWPIAGGGPVDVIASIDGVESLALSYLYIVPDQPILAYLSGPSCPADINALQVDAYRADGKSEAETVELVADSAIFETDSGLKSSTTVTAGNLVPLGGVVATTVTVTATPVVNAAVAAKLTFAMVPSGTHCKLLNLSKISQIEIVGPGPVENVPLRGLFGQDGRSVLWAPSEDFVHARHYATMKVAADQAVSPISDLEVLDLGSGNLQVHVREHPYVYVRTSEGRNRVRFLGPDFLLQSRTRQQEGALRSPVLISFSLSKGDKPSPSHILHLAPGAKSWVEVTSSVDRLNDEFVLRASVMKLGTYALVADTEPLSQILERPSVPVPSR